MDFTDDIRLAAKINRERKPATMSGIFECALAEGCDYGRAEDVVNAHYQNLQNQDYRALAGLKNHNADNQ